MMLRIAILYFCCARFVKKFKTKLNCLQNLLLGWWTTSPESKAASYAVLWCCWKYGRNYLSGDRAPCAQLQIAVPSGHRIIEDCQKLAVMLKVTSGQIFPEVEISLINKEPETYRFKSILARVAFSE